MKKLVDLGCKFKFRIKIENKKTDEQLIKELS
jgi:hypothetical protein